MTQLQSTLEWFGATTFRLRTRGLTIFLDTWLERPSALPKYLAIEDVDECDYIFISHAHFDHLPGADRLAIRTGAIVIANCEAINILAAAGVPQEQLIQVQGGERIPLFTKSTRDDAKSGRCPLRPAPQWAPPIPDTSLSVAAAHVWPSLHCFMPASHPEFIDTAEEFSGAADEYVCTVDITRGMQHGLLKMDEHMPRSAMNEGMISFVDYVKDRKRNVFSHCDGGQIMVNFIVDGKAMLWNAHLGAYEGIMTCMEPKPEIAILGIPGRANLNGRPFDGSAAQFALKEVRWLDEPRSVIWCLHDESVIKPYGIDVRAATRNVEENSKSRVVSMKHAQLLEFDF